MKHTNITAVIITTPKTKYDDRTVSVFHKENLEDGRQLFRDLQQRVLARQIPYVALDVNTDTHSYAYTFGPKNGLVLKNTRELFTKAADIQAEEEFNEERDHQCYYTDTPDGFACPHCLYF